MLGWTSCNCYQCNQQQTCHKMSWWQFVKGLWCCVVVSFLLTLFSCFFLEIPSWHVFFHFEKTLFLTCYEYIFPFNQSPAERRSRVNNPHSSKWSQFLVRSSWLGRKIITIIIIIIILNIITIIIPTIIVIIPITIIIIITHEFRPPFTWDFTKLRSWEWKTWI